MPGRIRSLKPDFWTDPAVVGLPAISRLFFIGSWNFADDYGVLKDDPERLRLQILPSDPVDAVAIVAELVAADLLLRRVAPDGTAVLVIRTFCAHQRIDSRATGRWGKPDTFAEQGEQDLPASPPDPAQSRAIPTHYPLEGTGLEGRGLDVAGTADADTGAKPRKRRTQIPTDFELSEERRRRAIDADLPSARVDNEFEKFLAYHQSTAGPKADWDAAWRYWVRNYRGPKTVERINGMDPSVAQALAAAEGQP